MKTETIGTVLSIALIIFLLVGEIKCIVKMFKCNWEPVGKAEILYTVGTFTTTGCIIGWLDIEDK